MEKELLEIIKKMIKDNDILYGKGDEYYNGKDTAYKEILDVIKELSKKVSRVELPVKPEIAEELEKQFLERQLAKIEVLSCKGDPCGNHLPTKILLQLGKETKWFIKVD